jgi:hypothetical protein
MGNPQLSLAWHAPAVPSRAVAEGGAKTIIGMALFAPCFAGVGARVERRNFAEMLGIASKVFEMGGAPVLAQ